MAELTVEQQRAMAMASARMRMNQTPQSQERGTLSPFFKKSDGSYGWAVPQIALDALDAFTLPGDVASGKVDPMSDEGMSRATNAGMFMTPGTVAGRAAPAAPQAVSAIGKKLRQDQIDPTSVNARLRALGPEATLPDISPNAATSAGGLASLPGKPQGMLREAMEARASGASGRVANDVDSTIGRTGQPLAMADEIIARQKAKADPLYAEVRNSPVEVTGAIAQALQTDMGRKAFQQGLRMASNDGIKPGQGLTVGMIDYVKRALDDMASSAARSGNNNAARQAGNMARAIRGAVDEQVPQYRAAREAFAGEAAILEALETGQTVFNNKVTPEALSRLMKDMTRSEREALLDGARAQIAGLMGTARNDALKVRQIFGQGYNREKLEALIGAEDATKLVNAIEREITFGRTQNTVLGNSETARRSAAQAELNPQRSNDRLADSLWNRVERVWNSAKNKVLGMNQSRKNEDLARLLLQNQFTPEQVGQMSRPRSLGLPVPPMAGPYLTGELMDDLRKVNSLSASNLTNVLGRPIR